MPGDEYLFSFLFANQHLFQLTNKTRLRFKTSAFVPLINGGYGLTFFKYRHIAKPYRYVQSMKTLIFISVSLILACTLKTGIKRHIFIPAVGWRFEVPSKFSFNDSAFNKEGQLTEAIPDDGSNLKLLA